MSHITCYTELGKRDNRSVGGSDMNSLMSEQTLDSLIITPGKNPRRGLKVHKVQKEHLLAPYSFSLYNINPFPASPWWDVCPCAPRVQDRSHSDRLMSARAESGECGHRPVWGAGPVSETEPGIWTPAVTRCTGHVSVSDTWRGKSELWPRNRQWGALNIQFVIIFTERRNPNTLLQVGPSDSLVWQIS